MGSKGQPTSPVTSRVSSHGLTTASIFPRVSINLSNNRGGHSIAVDKVVITVPPIPTPSMLEMDLGRFDAIVAEVEG